jgi:hypothetical protein
MQKVQTEGKEDAQAQARRAIKGIMYDYIIRINSRYRANEFTSSQLAKKIVTTMEVEKTRFPIIHRLVKEILTTWEDQGLCTHISRTKYSRCRKTKDTYRFSSQGIKEIKKQTIEETIRGIGEGELKESPIMRSRETIIKDRLDALLDNLSTTGYEATREYP